MELDGNFVPLNEENLVRFGFLPDGSCGLYFDKIFHPATYEIRNQNAVILDGSEKLTCSLEGEELHTEIDGIHIIFKRTNQPD